MKYIYYIYKNIAIMHTDEQISITIYGESFTIRQESNATVQSSTKNFLIYYQFSVYFSMKKFII